MVFEFRIWGLFILFFLIILTFWKKEKNTYTLLVVATYILEFLYILCFIKSIDKTNDILFLKAYYITLCGILNIFIYYFMTKILKDKYNLEQTKLDKQLKLSKTACLLIFITSLVILLILPNKKTLWQVTLFFASFSTISQLVILITENRNIKAKILNILLAFILIEATLIVFQYQFPKIEVLESGIIILVTYLYLTLENGAKEEIETLTLERNYAMKNTINKEIFLKKLSHEIRIPLNTIDGFSQVIEETKNIEELQEEAKDIRTASKDLISLVNSMIDLNIIESGELELLKENYNIYEVIEDLEDMLNSRLKNTNIKFNYEIEKDIPEVLLGDSERLSQIILNILSNSIKYTQDGTISLEINSVKSDTICRLIIKIKDTGKGMTKEEINSLLSETDESKGLGIKIAYHLIKLMNGKLDIESEKEKGTEVTITIDQEIVREKAEKKTKNKRKIEPVSLKDKRVLLVDDNRLNLKVTEKLLLPYELEVTTVESGQECLDTLEKDNQFDLILMDDLMPNLSGTETLDILRKVERLSGYYIPVVALTANATTGMKEDYLNKGFDDYLKKPIERDELDRVLKEFLKK